MSSHSAEVEVESGPNVVSKMGNVAKATGHALTHTDLADVGHAVQGAALVTVTVVKRPFALLRRDVRDARTLARAAKIMQSKSDA